MLAIVELDEAGSVQLVLEIVDFHWKLLNSSCWRSRCCRALAISSHHLRAAIIFLIEVVQSRVGLAVVF